MGFRYVVLGAGRQGTAAAYDLARFGEADAILLVDARPDVAAASAARVNALAAREVATPLVTDVTTAGRLLEGAHVCLSAVPYFLNLDLTHAAIEARVHFCDLGGNTDVVLAQLGLDEQARQSGVAIVPDCGVGPGLIANLAVHAIEQLDEARDVLIYDGGLPQKPSPRFNYRLWFAVEGLTNEYAGDALYIENYDLARVPCFDEREYELVDIPGVGRLEAFSTAGGLSTMSSTWRGHLRTLKNKTLRYPGHAAMIRSFIDIGLMSLDPVEVDGAPVVPRHLLHALLTPRFAPASDDRDLMVIHIVAYGIKKGAPHRVTVDMLDLHDEATGFSAMERTTGFHLAIVAGMLARGHIALGAVPLEVAVPARRMVEEVAMRGMRVETTVASEVGVAR